MKFPNGFFGNGPGNGDDTQSQRDIEAYNRSRLQFTVATSTFAGIAIVGMFCSCLWFVCCRGSSKTRKKGRTWATANPEAGLQNPYSYDGYMDSQGYMQMNNDGVAPYMSNPLYPSPFYGDNGLPSAYDFNEHFGLNNGVNGANKAALIGNSGLNSLCGNDPANPKDIPPSYTALFFAASDNSGIGGQANKNGASGEVQSANSADNRVTNIQPIHLKVTSHTDKQKMTNVTQPPVDNDEDEDDYDFLNKEYPSDAPPVSLLSVESATENKSDKPESSSRDETNTTNTAPNDANAKSLGRGIMEDRHDNENPPPYNPGFGYKGYMKF